MSWYCYCIENCGNGACFIIKIILMCSQHLRNNDSYSSIAIRAVSTYLSQHVSINYTNKSRPKWQEWCRDHLNSHYLPLILVLNVSQSRCKFIQQVTKLYPETPFRTQTHSLSCPTTILSGSSSEGRF